MNMNRLREFYKGKRVLVTGHTGFKGAWMLSVLKECGAIITGYALTPPTQPSLFNMLGYDTDADINNVYADVRDLNKMKAAFDKAQPEIVIHMAAQPIVRESYRDPVGTYGTNVMGTVNVLECTRLTESVKSFVNVTTDKVYKNGERAEGYREDEELNGYDPYSNSKSCSELVTDSYRKSFFIDEKSGRSILPSGRVVAISTMRAGNVIGGGDFAKDRIIPDCIRAAMTGKDIIVRNPYSTRPYQHVLEPVCMYLYVAMRQYEDASYAGAYNIGPRDEDAWTTGEMATLFCDTWNKAVGDKLIKWVNKSDNGPHEATYLKLDINKVKDTFGWEPRWSVSEAMEKIIEWTTGCSDGKTWTDDSETVKSVTKAQIEEYLKQDL